MTTDLTAMTCKVLGCVYLRLCIASIRNFVSMNNENVHHLTVSSISSSVQLLSRLVYIDVGETDCKDLVVVLDEVASKAVLLKQPSYPIAAARQIPSVIRKETLCMGGLR
jgi:hypothetical protein